MKEKNCSERAVRLFELIQVTPCTGFVAVFAVSSKEDESKLVLESSPVDAIGVATVTSYSIKVYTDENGKFLYSKKCSDDDVYNEIVALQLNGYGGWEILDEIDNYAGICKDSDDISQVILNLKSEHLDRLVKNQE